MIALLGACASFAINFNDENSVAALRQHLKRYLRIRSLFAVDYYPLTEWNNDPTQWLAFQFHDPAKDEGFVQAFCGADAKEQSRQLKLRGLNPSKTYYFTDWDNPSMKTTLRSPELMEKGIEVKANKGDNALVLFYSSQP